MNKQVLMKVEVFVDREDFSELVTEVFAPPGIPSDILIHAYENIIAACQEMISRSKEHVGY